MVVKPEDRLGKGERKLTLEIRGQKFAFALIERSQLIEWGTRTFAPGTSGVKAGIAKLAFLLKIYVPSVVIARSARTAKHESSKRALTFLRTIDRELTARAVPFVVLPRAEVDKFFAERGCGNKSEIASLIAERFIEFKTRKPRPRKPWDPEARIAPVFDAIATALVFTGRESG